MRYHVNTDKIKMAVKQWYDDGRHTEFQKRSDEEISSYMDALEIAIRTTLESFGHTDVAVYETHSVWNKIDEYIDDLISIDTENWYKEENGDIDE